MAIRKKTSTTRLPQALQQQIDESSANDHHPQRQKHQRPGSRKDARKQERASQKQRKAQHFSQVSNARKRPAEEDHSDSPQRKKPRQTDSSSSSKSKAEPQKIINEKATAMSVTATTPQPQPSSARPAKSTKSTALEKLAKPKKSALATPKTPQEDPEDSYIAYLEAQLRGEKKGSKHKAKSAEEDDGLDDLMNWADSFVAPKTTSAISDNEESESESESEQSLEASDSDNTGEYASDEEWHGITEDIPELQSTVEETCQPTNERKTGAYVPPHLRNAQTDPNSEAIQKLTRQLKGLLNRMSEQNIGSIVDSIEEVYRDHRRNDVTSTLTTLIINGISSHSSLLDSYVVLYAAFVSGLHKIIGVEFAAHFVQSAVASYEQFYATLQNPNTETEQDGKECSNLLVLLSELYNFQVISCVLVFDIIRALLDEDLSEFKVELLLKIVRNSGHQLRLDDPSALKDIIEIVQSKTSTKDDALSSRTRFMIETLTNLKNNKLKRNVAQNQGGAAVERMKKFLSGLAKSRHVLAHDALRVSLEDLHSAGTKGKWWLVGAAWSGDPLVDKQAEFAQSPATKDKGRETNSNESADLIKLARSQGMNTDIRRGIFVVLMSSEDYVDACERLSQLNLTELQQREIIRVLLQCCGNERSYNPYYTLVCQQLCRLSHSYKITLQFSLWDFLRDLGEKSVGGAAVVKNLEEAADDFDLKSISETRMRNVANAYAWWIAKDCVTLLILKPVDFTILRPQTRAFMKEMLTQIFINSQRPTPLVTTDYKNLTFTRNRNVVQEIFTKAARIQALAMGLVYFLSDTFKDKSAADEYSKFIRWAVGVAKDTLRTSVDIASVL